MRFPLPAAPSGVRIIDTDDVEYPVNVVYREFDGEVHVWDVFGIPRGIHVKTVRVAKLPAKSAVQITKDSWKK